MFECSICAEEFKNTDEVFSTTCGHIFHLNCLQTWVNGNGNCPQCRHENPGSHKIFLNFDEATKKQRENRDLRALLQERKLEDISRDESDMLAMLERSKLENELEQSVKLCFELEEKIEYVAARHESVEQDNVLKVTEINDLQERLKSLELNLLQKTTENKELQNTLAEREIQLEAQLLEIDDLIVKARLLSGYTKNPTAVMENSENETSQTLTQECQQLKEKLRCETQEKKKLLEQKIALDEKLKQIQLELQEEIRLSTDAKIMQSLIEQEIADEEKVKKCVTGAFATHATKSIGNAIIIKGLTASFNPKDTVLKLAQKMQLHLCEADIEDTAVIPSCCGISLIVEFRIRPFKVSFLTRADKLKHYVDTHHIEVCDYSGCLDI